VSDVHLFLADTWYLLLGVILALYVVTDGFDLGVGILSLFERDSRRHGWMMATLDGVWDANETWLVLFGGALFGAFPAVYAVILHALYIPVIAMLLGLVLRGVAFEFRTHTRYRRIWDLAFGCGSLLAALAQGFALGALISGLPVVDGHFAAGVWFWFSPFSTLVALGVVAGYSLLGGTYLVMKTSYELQAISRCYSARAGWLTLVAAVCVTLATPLFQHYVAQRLLGFPGILYFAPLPLLALGAFVALARALRSGAERSPFFWSLAVFVLSFAGLAASLYPYLVPPSMNVADSASASGTLVFMLVGIGMLFPVMLVYNGYQYLVLGGKVGGEHGESTAPESSSHGVS